MDLEEPLLIITKVKWEWISRGKIFTLLDSKCLVLGNNLLQIALNVSKL